MDQSDDRATGTSPGRDYSAELLEAIVRALPTWVDTTVRRTVGEATGVDDATLRAAIDGATVAMVDGVRSALGDLFAHDPEEQRVNPLQVLRAEARVVTGCLRRLGAGPVARDEFERTSLPDDVFGVGPLAWRDLGEEVHDAGITWGAWKAAIIMARHRTEGSNR